MEQTDSSAPECTNPNGFVNRVFHVALDVANETSTVCVQDGGPAEGESPAQTPVRDRQEVNRRSRTTGGIWRILNRKRTVPELDRRPHSMILPGEAIPKLSFADKVRSFKKLKSPSVFRSKGKLSAKFSTSLVDEESFCHDVGTPQQHSRSTLQHRGKRHSYAGYTADFDCSFEDLDLIASAETSQPTVTGEPTTQNGVKPAERVCYTKRNYNNSSNCNKASGCEEPNIKDSPRTHRGGGRRHKDVWSYLRRISLLGKANAAYSERSFDSELHSLDKTMDSDFGSVDFETVKEFNQPLPKHADTKGHFGGLFKFFNSVAETARKWRTTTRSFSPPEGEKSPVSSPRAQPRTASNIHSVSLTIHPESQSQLHPSAPLSTKSSGSFSSEPTGRQRKGSHKNTHSGSHTANGLQTQHVNRDSVNGPSVIVKNGPIKAEVVAEALKMEDESVAGQTGNEQDSRDAPPDSTMIQEVNVQSQHSDKDSSTNSVPASDSTEEIFKLCEQIASQTGSSARQPCPAVHHSSSDRTSLPHNNKPVRLRRRPASAVLDLHRPGPERDYYSHYSEVGSLCRRRRRPAPGLVLSPGQRRMAARSRPCSVIETSVNNETQFTELQLRALSRPPGVSPLEPPLKAALQRCRSLPLPSSTLTALALRLPQSDMGQSSSVRLRSGSCRRRRLLRPGSEPLQVNIDDHAFTGLDWK